PEMIMQRALKIANNTINQLETKIERDKPKIVFADAVATTKTSILVGELAKIIKQNGINIGQRRLFEWLRQRGFLIKRKGVDYNMPTQYS
ncbi:phage antirepressor KilAC domain-containing protein, partial [Staphylococcus aureus]|uniref:phage antirepressor KilAC domain-containing protein n=1 Tax=Staphylococcus aureus TaxID=1280 RepID=UPI001F098C01